MLEEASLILGRPCRGEPVFRRNALQASFLTGLLPRRKQSQRFSALSRTKVNDGYGEHSGAGEGKSPISSLEREDRTDNANRE
jgi:hypothetical protein